MHPRRGGHLGRGGAALPRGRGPGAGSVPGASVAGPGLRRARAARSPRPRQDGDARARRADDLRRPAQPARRRSLPLARGRCGPAGLPAAHGHGSGGRRGDGDPPPRPAGRGRAVSPRVDPHRDRSAPARQLPGARAHPRLAVPNPLLTDAIDRLASRQDLSADEAGAVLGEIMSGSAAETEIAGFLIALRTKGETVEEITGLARTMRARAESVSARRPDLLDTAGTGGGRPTFNVSTTAALIAAGAGCAVAKHGNRSATRLSGSAGLLEAVGARIR